MTWYSTLKQTSISKIKQFFNAMRSAVRSLIQWIKEKVQPPKPAPSSSLNMPSFTPLDLRTEQGFTPLMLAVFSNNILEVKRLLSLGVNIDEVNRKPDWGRTQTGEFGLLWELFPDTALGLAIRDINVEMITLLLTHKASTKFSKFKLLQQLLNKKTFKNNKQTDTVLDFIPDDVLRKSTPEQAYRISKIIQLITTYENSYIKPKTNLFKFSLKHGDTPTIKKTLTSIHENQEESTASHFLEADFYDLGIYQEYPTNRFEIPITNHTPISYALSNNQTKIVIFLLGFAHEKLSTEKYNKILNETFICACYYNNLAIIEFCLKQISIQDIDKVASSNSKLNALKTATSTGSIEAMQYLLNNNATINHRNDGHFLLSMSDMGNTALFFAIKSNLNKEKKEDTVSFLINNGSKLDPFALRAIKELKFIINFEKIYVPIEFMDTLRWNMTYHEERFKEIIDKVNEHNKILRKKIVDKTNKALESVIFPVLMPIIYDYLFLSCPANLPSTSEESEINSKRKPRA